MNTTSATTPPTPTPPQQTPSSNALRFTRNTNTKGGGLATVSASQAIRYGIDRQPTHPQTISIPTLSFSSVSALDPNVIFQDIDRPKSRSNIREKSSVSQDQQQVYEPDVKTMGLIGNVFLGSTSKYMKGVDKPSVTAAKGKDTIQQVVEVRSPRDVGSAAGKFSRNREQKDISESRLTEARPRYAVGREIVESQEGTNTDRSNITEGGRKIERRQERVRDLKFREKSEKAESMIDLGIQSQVSNFTSSQYEQTESRITVEQGYDQQEFVSQPTIVVSKASTITQRKIVSHIQESRREQTQVEDYPTMEKVSYSRISRATPSKIEQPKPTSKPLPRSPVILLLLRRLFKNRHSQTFSTLKTNRLFSRIHNNQQLSILTSALTQIVSKKLTNLKANCFEILKKRFAGVYIAELKPYVTAEIKNSRNLVASVLDRLYISKMRVNWNVLSRNRELVNLKLKVVRMLGIVQRRKAMSNMQSALEVLKVGGRWRENAATQLCKIVQLVNKLKLCGGFAQLYRFARKANTESSKMVKINRLEVQTVVVVQDNPILIQKIEALTQNKQTIEVEIAELTGRTEIKKGEASNQNEERSHKIGLMAQQNEQMKVELQIRKSRNELLRVNVDKLSPIHDHPIQEDDKETKINAIANLYITLYRSTQPIFHANQIAETYSLHVQDNNSLISEWQSLLTNIRLKRTVAQYENVQERSHKARQSLMDEQLLVVKLVRSYTSELYCWQWIHLQQSPL